ncbi:MAG: tetratricopeptide repeat protein, partial [Thermus sp.]
MRTPSLLLLLGLALATPLEEARELYAQGEMAGVLARLGPLLQGYDPPEEALLLAGFAQYRLGRLEEALFTFSRLVGTLKGGSEALYGFGLTLRALGDPEGARAALDWALRQGYREAEGILDSLPAPPSLAPKARKAPPPFRAEKGRLWIGDKPFQVRGVNLGVALPGRFPAEFQEEGLEDWEGPFLDRFLLEGREVLDALHGNLSRPPRPGHAHGEYAADVSPWVMGLLVGREFEPYSVEAYNRRHLGRTYRGRFLEASPEASPFEAYLAEVLDRLATYEWEAYGTVRPLSVSNWPTLDPLFHLTESTRSEEISIRRARGERIRDEDLREFNNDEVALDMTKIRPIPGSPVTVFANYHAYPYYPDFMNLDPKYGKARGPFGPS